MLRAEQPGGGSSGGGGGGASSGSGGTALAQPRGRGAAQAVAVNAGHDAGRALGRGGAARMLAGQLLEMMAEEWLLEGRHVTWLSPPSAAHGEGMAARGQACYLVITP